MQITSAPLTNAKLLAVVLTQDNLSVPAELDAVFGGGLSALISSEKFKAKPGSSLTVRGMGRSGHQWVGLFGSGKGDAQGARLAAGAASFFARSKGLESMTLQLAGGGAAHAEAVGEGVVSGNYRYDRYLSGDRCTTALSSVSVQGLDAPDSALQSGAIMGAARALARDLINEPPDDIYPETLAAAATKLRSDCLTVEVWDQDRLGDAGMVGTTAVGQGSARKPRFVHMTYTPKGASKGKVALVGKGVTFDAGGLSIKPSAGMLTMKCDMGGAATVIGVMSALEALEIPVTVHGLFAAAENLLAGNSYKLGDVLRFDNGTTVEIHNTDAEGRLLLADCLCYASKLDVTHIVDLATLTGAAVVALGEHFTALYANDADFGKQLLAAADIAGEGLWNMPLEPSYNELIKSDIADIKNVGSRAGGSITAGLFLQNFVAKGKTWAHLDIAGPAFLSKPENHLDKGGAGPQVVTLIHWLRSL